MPPLVSVLLPFYNAAGTIHDAISSLLNQEFRSFEVIAVDDGSSDDSAQIVSGFGDGRIRLYRRDHRGLVAALNFGLGQCSTDLIARMDADDLSAPGRLGAQFQALAADGNLGVVSCLVEAFSKDGAVGQGMQRYLAWQNRLTTHQAMSRERFIESPLVHPSVMFRTELLQPEQRYEDNDYPEDYALWLKAFDRGIRFGKVERVLFHWRDGMSRATRQDPRYGRERFRAVKLRHLLPLCRARTVRDGAVRDGSVVFVGAGLEGKPFLRALQEAQVRVPVVLDLDRRKWGNVVYGARVLDPARFVPEDFPQALYLVAIGVPEARDEVRSLLHFASEGEDLLFLA